MPIDYDAIQVILGKLTAEERDVIAGQMKARALVKPPKKLQNRYTETVQLADGTKVTFSVGTKGNVRVYGLDRKRPMALYRHQWLRVLEVADELRIFIDKNKERLK